MSACLIDLAAQASPGPDGLAHCIAAAGSFTVAWSAGDHDAPLSVESEAEYFVLLPDAGATLSWAGGTVQAPARSICIMPKGGSAVHLAAPGRMIRLFAPAPAALLGSAVQTAYGPTGLRPLVPRFRSRRSDAGPALYVIDDMPNASAMPRARLLQSETMSISWIEYRGRRDRSKLSPHAHTDFEQGSLALEGRYIHHLRTPWGADANAWVGDAHLACAADSVTFIPPPILHTTEGIGDDRQILVDVFAPARTDFIARDQVFNAADYEPVDA